MLKTLLNRAMRVPRRLAKGYLPLQWLKRFAPLDAVTLYYHIVSDQQVDHQRYYRFKTPVEFLEDLTWIAEEFGFAEYDEVRNASVGTSRVPPNRVLLTFDDGFAECHEIIAPLLTRFRANAVFFVTTGYLNDEDVFHESQVSLCLSELDRASEERVESVADVLGIRASISNLEELHQRAAARLSRCRLNNLSAELRRAVVAWLLVDSDDRLDKLERVCDILEVCPATYRRTCQMFMTERQVRDLAEQGFVVGAHSLSHRRLQQLPEPEQEREILESCDRIRQITGRQRVPFSFPYSARGVDDALLERVRSRNPFVDLYFDTGGLRSSRPSMVNRIWAEIPDQHGIGAELRHHIRTMWL